MRTLKEITDAARRGEQATEKELRLAICAYDVLLSKLNLSLVDGNVKEYFIAAEKCPSEYIGWANHPDNPEFLEWHNTTMKAVDSMDGILAEAERIMKEDQ